MKTYRTARAAAGTAVPRRPVEQLRDYRADEKVRRGSFDLPFFVLTLVILAIGVVMVLSASFARDYYTNGNPLQHFSRQIIFAITGVVLMVIVSTLKVATLRKFAFPLMVISLLLLASVPVIGSEENGARRWINLGFTTFQPSEIAKLAEVLMFAVMICTYKEKMKTFKYGVAPFMAVVVVIVGLLYLEPHLSASVIVIALAAIMMFAGGTKMKWFLLAGGVIILVAYLTISKMDYASSRITAWLHPENDPGDSAYQILQSLYAIGSGGLMGLGLGQGRQKYLYLPEEHNDYIFAIVCEELGYVGAILILLLFALLIVRGFWLALHARDRFGSLVVTGLSSLLAIQVFLNVAVVTNLLPSTGISLPFFSYGGTALWIQLVEMGIILSISRDIPIVKAG
ncbi:cell division protein FtsW [Sporobacter termitidis DSM 10068]|uniref:Probable peptidoglycan glycosyltransferase FtsW n=1 Tax=Sporobacter termitidis DSM 10068 TaxID=1123282 RepID=A0A1M5WZ52_9FIRM|nr:putative lipid II flippase FtsW [Sporobacter termitidis]SHH92899.1 cell division protein FtsW [Sporobacter termitidis DSM 10068]